MKHAAVVRDLTGRTIAERYDLLELIGTGGMGSVYRARDRELDELVALKVIRDDLSRDPAMLERFRHEVRLARRVTHVNVARTFELGRSDGVVFCTMELIVGESLTRRLAREHRLSLSEAVAIACAMCDGLAAAHTVGVIHRDIKPDNVLLAEDGRVVVADFGVAAIAAAEGELSGTPAYMAPEQARGEPPGPAGDVYSVGVVLFELLHGRRDVPSVELPGELEALLTRATAPERELRIASAAALRHELGTWNRASRPTMEAFRGEHAASHEATVIVIAPRGRDDRMYLGEAVYDRVLALLGRTPHVRVLARAEDEHADVLATLTVGDALDVKIRRHGTELGLRLPLDFHHVESSALAIANATVTAIAAPAPAAPGPTAEAHELMLQARYHAWRDMRSVQLASDQIARAHQLLPSDPKVAAVIALVLVRRAFFLADAPADTLARAAAAAQLALAAAPDLPDSWLSAGHVDLHHGNPVVAARRYRTAIARAPHHAEAHE
jgi:serine/threonine-protein kinase